MKLHSFHKLIIFFLDLLSGFLLLSNFQSFNDRFIYFSKLTISSILPLRIFMSFVVIFFNCNNNRTHVKALLIRDMLHDESCCVMKFSSNIQRTSFLFMSLQSLHAERQQSLDVFSNLFL